MGGNNNPEGVGGFQEHPELINKKGRPDFPISDLLRGKANEKIKLKDKQTGVITEKERKVAIVEVLWNLAISGDLKAIKEIIDRLEGKSRQRLDLFGNMDFSEDRKLLLEIVKGITNGQNTDGEKPS